MVMVMDRKMLLLDRLLWVYQFLDQLQRNVFDVELWVLVVECIVVQQEFVHLVAEKERNFQSETSLDETENERKYLLIYFFASFGFFVLSQKHSILTKPHAKQNQKQN